jgi:hypothetical protein
MLPEPPMQPVYRCKQFELLSHQFTIDEEQPAIGDSRK